MSPSATGGPPHTRAVPVNGGGPVSTSNGGKVNGVDSGMSTKNIWLHHDDLVAATPELDIHSPIDKILREGERFAKAADTSLDFRRPDIALQEYVKASIIAAEIIPRHKDFPALQSDRKELHRAYMGLTKRIKSQDEKFMNVKKMIKENNAIHGTRPRDAISNMQELSSKALENSIAKTPPNAGIANQSPRKNPPPIQPKPDALHGKAIPHAGIHTGNASQADLATRFARLRSPEASSQFQDPRIRTQPIPIPEISNSSTGSTPPKSGSTINKPNGPREMPSVPTTVPRPNKTPLDVNIPRLPRAPDAIYSPARGTENAAVINLPSSIARSNSYLGGGRQNSAPPISTVGPTTPGLVDKTDYFSQAQKPDSNTQPRKSLNEQRVVLPKKTTLTAEELMGYLRQGSHAIKILLVDLRSREDFDNGHILSQFIICVEPITLRHGISGDELADSMVIAPDVEQKTFELRQTFDLVVFYDQSSNSTNPPTPTEASKKLHDFASAVYDYGYEKRLKQPPVLLVGGLNAWIDLLGPSSLETSSTGKTLKSIIPNGVKKARPLNSISKPRGSQAASSILKTYQSRPLSSKEEKMWESTLQEEKENANSTAEDSASNEIVYARTTEDFMRRYPELPSIQESMISPVVKTSVHPLEAELNSTMAKPPARPPPALSRQRSSGISEKGTMVPYSHQAAAPNSISELRQPRGLTGLLNPANVCYLNSVIQCLSATPFLRNLLNASDPPPAVPRKGNETTNPPQLMVKCLKNVINHLWCGQWDFINPKTFRDYVNAVHSKVYFTGANGDRSRAFGGSRQHDASEFLTFLLAILDDELNQRRNCPDPGTVPLDLVLKFTNDYSTLAEGGHQWWRRQFSNRESPLARNITGLACQVLLCSNCGKETRNFTIFEHLDLIVPDQNGATLQNIIEFNYGINAPKASVEIPRECDFCPAPVAGQKRTKYPATFINYIVHWPETLVIYLNRYTDSGRKILTPVTFLERMNFSSCKHPETPSPTAEVDPRSSLMPLYEVYGCIKHEGQTLDSGHYIAITRSPDIRKGTGAGDWHYFSDQTVNLASFRRTQTMQDGVATILFLQRVKT